MPETQPTRNRQEFIHPTIAAAQTNDWTLPAEPIRRKPSHGHQPVLFKRQTGKRPPPASTAGDQTHTTSPDD